MGSRWRTQQARWQLNSVLARLSLEATAYLQCQFFVPFGDKLFKTQQAMLQQVTMQSLVTEFRQDIATIL